ncbi:MAG: helix-turn-helix transcriptional regulator [Flavobacteriales bacterium]
MKKGIRKNIIKFVMLSNIVLSGILIHLLTGCTSNIQKEHLSKQLVDSLDRIDQKFRIKNPEIRIKKINQIRLKVVENDLKQVIGRSEISLAYVYSELNDNKNVLENALKASKILSNNSLNERVIFAESLRLIAKEYYYSEHYLEALDYTDKTLNILSDTEKEHNSLIIKGLTYNLQAKIFDSIRNPHRQLESLRKSFSCFQTQKKSAWYNHLIGNVYNDLASYFYTLRKKYRFCFFYIEKALNVLTKIKNYNAKGASYLHLGDIYLTKKDTLKALQYYKRSEVIFDSIHQPFKKVKSYYNMAKVYEALHNDSLKNHYKTKYLVLEDSIETLKKDLTYIVNQNITEQNQKTISKSKNQLIIYFVVGFLVLILIMGVIWIRLQNKYKYNLEEIEKKIEEKIQIIKSEKIKANQFKMELFTLKNQNLDKLKESLKKEDKLFLAKFEEIYPDFISGLKKDYPNLSVNDLKFCALTKLNFSTKEIADINHVTIKAIEIKRYRIRKKINLSSKTNFEKWIQNVLK